MAKVKFKRIEDSSHINDIDIEDGAFIVTKDGKSYIDYGNDRIPTNGTPDTEISDISHNSVENKVIKEYVDDSIEEAKNTLSPTRLYFDSNGSGGNINLSDSISNYSYLEIFYKRSENYASSVKIDLAVTKKASLTSTYYTGNSFFIDTKNIEINNTSISVTNNAVMYSSGGNVSVGTNNNIQICEVLGYK